MVSDNSTPEFTAEQLADRLVSRLIRRFSERNLSLTTLADALVCGAGAIYSSEAGLRATAEMFRRTTASIEEQLQG